MSDLPSIIGFVLFAFSEFLSFLPIKGNGLLHMISLGVNKTFQQPNQDIELATSLMNKSPNIANIVSQIATNSHLADTVHSLSSNPQLIPCIHSLSSNKDISFILNILNEHPTLINDTKKTIEQLLLNSYQQTS
jgi:hypothetical protein